jgi:hypothetical protein
MWLNFKVTDSNNNIVFESGKIKSDGSIDGADNDSDQTIFEPHYNLITSADQVQIYEPVMVDTEDNITYTLLRAARYIKDNRLTPKGFNKLNNVPEDVAVLGNAYDDKDFNLGSDELTYSIPVAVAGELNVSVSLNYQAIAHGFLQDLYRDAHLPQVQTFKTLYDAQSLKHEQVASAQTTVVSDGGGTPPAPVVNLSADPATIDQGASATLSWTSTDTTSCTASWNPSIATSGSEPVNPDVTTTYDITCIGDGGSASDSVTVTVNQPPVANEPTVNLTASPSIVRRGGTITLSWTSTDASSCSVSGDWSGAIPIAGSQSIVINSPITLTLTCSGDGGSASDTVSYQALGRRWLELI